VAELTGYTAQTVTSRSRLHEELEQVRARGWAVAVDELEVGLTAAAAPIRNMHGDVIASMSVSGPTFRMPEDTLAEVVERLTESALEVSHRLGWGQR
jgi:DNA-binding IclR family transcriptional regulator